MSSRKRPVHRLGDLLPGIAAQLGLTEELQGARALASWTRIVEELVPAATGASQLLEVRPPGALRVCRRRGERPGVAPALGRSCSMRSPRPREDSGLLHLQVVVRRPRTGDSAEAAVD